MNASLLISAIVQQLTVLIAQLATSSGVRAPLAHIASQVFLELAREIEAQGVSRKVSADMFGMVLRAYQRKLKRLTEQSEQGASSLWSELLDALQGEGSLRRSEILKRFGGDDEELVRALLHDLVQSGLIVDVGKGPALRYRLARDEELASREESARDALLTALVYRHGPTALDALCARTGLSRISLEPGLARLVEKGALELTATGHYATRDFSVPLGESAGWEAAVFDHVQAMVQTICQRLAGDSPSHLVGGSTYSFDIWSGHPLEAEVEGQLARFRAEHSALRERVDAYNETHGRPEHYRQIVLYGGQAVLVRERASGEPEGGEET